MAPWTPRFPRFQESFIRDYPDRDQSSLREVFAAIHELPTDFVLPGNGAAELFTWAARDAAAVGLNGLLAPGLLTTGELPMLGCGLGETIGVSLGLCRSCEPSPARGFSCMDM